MMPHAFVNRFRQSALLSNKATIPHYRANCFLALRLNCKFIIILFHCMLGIHGMKCGKVSLHQMMQKVRCPCGVIRPNDGLASCTEPHTSHHNKHVHCGHCCDRK
jgi:hypothetical protein